MIRRTVARAFGRTGEERPRMEGAVTEAQPGSRVSLLNALFQEMQEAFERGAARTAAGGKEAGGGSSLPPLAVSKARPRPDGLEFLVEGPGGSFRFLNSMDGVVRIFRVDGGRLREERLLTVGFEGGRCRTIERFADVPRAPFRFSSVPQIVKEFTCAVSDRVDTASERP